MNVVMIMTDTQTKSMVGAYGHPSVGTPNLDRLAATGIRFDRAYTASPLCTPARSALFTGMHPEVNGAWCNNMAPQANIPLTGTICRNYGWRAAYTGKWHLDGAGYFGDGLAGGGFEPDWWYDGKRYAEEIGPDMFHHYRTCKTADDLRQAGFTETTIWGHRVADRAIDFLGDVRDAPFVLIVSFDEPHGPFVAPPEYWEKFAPADIPAPPNFNAPLTNKPRLQQIQRQEHGDQEWEQYARSLVKFWGCNSYIDREIGRVIEAIERLHGDDTIIIYTADHGDMLGAHGLRSKGPMMYEETCNVPLIVRVPGGAAGVASQALVSHLDILPTIVHLSGNEPPACLHGTSLAPLLRNPGAAVRAHALLSFTRFAINHDDWGEFYPIRCIVDERYKLAINLFETDEMYDLIADPHEVNNLIDDPAHENVRARLHDSLLAEMDRIRDPFRSFRWGDRPWRTVRKQFYSGGERRNRLPCFPFQPKGLEADGQISG